MKALLSLVLLLSCSEDSNGLSDGAADTGSIDQKDATAADADPIDAETMDAETMDAEPTDADPIDTDASPADADPIDAEIADVGPDAGGCNGFGTPCMGEQDCDPALDCMENVCRAPGRPDCGGFVGTLCPPAFPECIFYTGADYGTCFTAQEVPCLCASPEGRAAFACP